MTRPVGYQAIYYRDSSEVEPVRDIMGALGATCRESVHWKIGLLNKLDSTNPELPDPHSSALKGKDYRAFRELRAHCALSRHRGSSHPYARTSGHYPAAASHYNRHYRVGYLPPGKR